MSGLFILNKMWNICCIPKISIVLLLICCFPSPSDLFGTRKMRKCEIRESSFKKIIYSVDKVSRICGRECIPNLQGEEGE